MMHIRTNSCDYTWHTDEPVPNVMGPINSIQADGDELSWVLSMVPVKSKGQRVQVFTGDEAINIYRIMSKHDKAFRSEAGPRRRVDIRIDLNELLFKGDRRTLKQVTDSLGLRYLASEFIMHTDTAILHNVDPATIPDPLPEYAKIIKDELIGHISDASFEPKPKYTGTITPPTQPYPSTLDANIRVEVQPTVFPKPISFVVFQGTKPVGVLTPKQVMEALAEYIRLYEAWTSSRG